MLEKIGEKVSVNFIYNHLNNSCLPRIIKWKQRVYKIEKLGLHYTLYRGSNLIHMFAVSNQSQAFLLSFNTVNLSWILEEIADNNSN